MNWISRLKFNKNNNISKSRMRLTCDELSVYLSFQNEHLQSMFKDTQPTILEDHIVWGWASGVGHETLIFELQNLDIVYVNKQRKQNTDRLADIHYGIENVSTSMQFTNCRFVVDDIDFDGVRFVPQYIDPDYTEQFIFNENHDGCAFSFPDHSSVRFKNNDFVDIVISRNAADLSMHRKGGLSVVFERNRMRNLTLDIPFPSLYPFNCRFVKGNVIETLWWEQVVKRDGFIELNNIVKYDDIQEYGTIDILFDRNEEFHNGRIDTRSPRQLQFSIETILDIRALFIRLCQVARTRGDLKQVKLLNSHIMFFEYLYVKNNGWNENWNNCQDFILLLWRKLSSKFYMSWVRPLIGLLVGYLGFNAVSMIYCDFTEYLLFCVYSATSILTYTSGLEIVLGVEKYKATITQTSEGWLNFIGLFRLLWITLWGYAFKNAIGLYRLK